MRWWRRLLRRDEAERQLDAELREHIERQVADYTATGMSEAEARRRARLTFGGVDQIKEHCRDVRGTRWIDEIVQDVRYGGRSLRKSPGFTTVAVLSIALGIGANTAIFTLLDQLLLRQLPVADPQELVLITSRGFQYGNGWGDGNELSYPMFLDFRDHNDVFTGMFCRFNFPLHVGFGGQTERVRGELVSGSYFQVLGVAPHLGRTFSTEEDRVPRGHPVAVLSHGYWKSRFAGDPDVVGRKIVVSNQPMTVIGVAQERFYGTNLGQLTQVFVPMTMSPLMTPMTDGLEDRRTRWLNVFGRLRPGMTPEQAQVSLQPFYASRLHMEVKEPGFARASSDDKAQFLKNQIEVRPAGHGKSDLRRELARPLWMLMAVVIGVLLIACANVANLLLARATVRQREIAVRLSLGAGRRRIVQQLVIESVVLAVLGGAAGLLLATWGSGVLLGLFVDPGATLTVSPSPDMRILAFTFALSTLTGLVFGLVPALKSTQPELAPTLKNEASSVPGGGQAGLRKALVVSQVALSLLLLIGAGLFIRSLRNLMTSDPGFETARLITFGVDPGLNGYQGVRSKQFAKTLLERIQSTPGVAAAAFGSNWLLTGGSWNSVMTIEGRLRDAADRVISHNNAVSPGYFETMGIALLAGRDFGERDERMVEVDRKLPPAGGVIANATFVSKYLGDGPVLGRRLGFGDDPGTATTLEIVGVVQDAKYRSIRNEAEPQLYFPYLAGPGIRALVIYVRAAQEPQPMFQTLRRVVQEVDPNLPMHSVRTVDEQIEQSLMNERLVASLSGAFSFLATLLAIVGLYGVMAYTVARRTREIGIRMALGALSAGVAWMIMRDVLRLVATGVALALPAAWALSRYVKSQLYGVTPDDPATIVLAVVLLAIAAAVAGLLPALRAARVNPITALRYD